MNQLQTCVNVHVSTGIYSHLPLPKISSILLPPRLEKQLHPHTLACCEVMVGNEVRKGRSSLFRAGAWRGAVWVFAEVFFFQSSVTISHWLSLLLDVSVKKVAFLQNKNVSICAQFHSTRWYKLILMKQIITSYGLYFTPTDLLTTYNKTHDNKIKS